MTFFYLGIGSNERPEDHCREMILSLRKRFKTLIISRLIQTKAEGVDAPDYYNAVVCIETGMTRSELNLWCKALEDRLGRIRGSRYCCADLDIILMVDTVESVDLSSIPEHYYQTLVEQLLLFQKKGHEMFGERGLLLALNEEETVGLIPKKLQNIEAICEA